MTNIELQEADAIMLGNTPVLAIYIGQDIIWPQVRELPTGYTEVEYIESTATGGQYIDLNLKMWETQPLSYAIDMKVYVTGAGLDNSDQYVVLGANDESSNQYPGFVIRRRFSRIEQNRNPNVGYGNVGEMVTIQQSQTNFTPERGTHNKTTTLFCGLDSNGLPFRYSNMRLYYCKIKSNSNSYVRDLVPCLNPLGIPGLYDLVYGVFYKSPNGVDFNYN